MQDPTDLMNPVAEWFLQHVANPSGLLIIAVAVATWPVMAAIRRILARRVQHLMQTRTISEEAIADEPSSVEEVHPNAPLTIDFQDTRSAESSLATEWGKAIWARRKELAGWWYLETLIFVGYFALFGFAPTVGAELPLFSPLIPAFLVLWLSARYWLMARQLRQIRASRVMAFAALCAKIIFLPIWGLIHPTYGRIVFDLYRMVLVGLGLSVLPHGPFQIVLIAYVAIECLVRYRHFQRTKNRDNIKLLILRVFDNDKNTSLLFGYLQNYW